MAFTVFFILTSVFIDKMRTVNLDANDPVIVNILLMAIMNGAFTLLTTTILPPAFVMLVGRLVLAMEGVFIVNISSCFVYYAVKHKVKAMSAMKVVFYIAAAYIAFFKVSNITASAETGFVVESPLVFGGDLAKVFPFTWIGVYFAVYLAIIPAFACLTMLLYQERKAPRLDRHRGYVDFYALAVFWVTRLFIHAISLHVPGLSLLYPLAYVLMLIMMIMASSSTSAMSRSDMFMFAVRMVFTYVVPAVIVGLLFHIFFGVYQGNTRLFVVIMAAVTAVVFVITKKVVSILVNNRMMHSGDYARAFEKDLAAMDYTGEMDAIAQNMFKIFKKNVECTSMKVFINDGKGNLNTAYSSDGSDMAFQASDPLFDELLNISRTVVAYSEIENSHELDEARDGLFDLLEKTQSDVLFVLNEGRNVLGFIVLGIKASGDHYKDYDIEVFKKLYSYFFVFGYYMRNIANKDIIGIVNRELRMASQIITSIQENVDQVKSPKLEAGYLMEAAHNIGGEFIDLVRLTDTSHLFVMGDLSGRGIAASMNMVILKSIIRTFLAETHDFKQLVVKVNSFIRTSLQKGTIFAGVFMLVDLKKEMLYYINCGVPTLLLYTLTYNNVIEIQGSGHILGFVKDISPYVSVKQTKLSKGDIILTCTDGLINSHSLRGEQFGKDRVQQNMLANTMYPAARMAQFQSDALKKFMSKELEDDISVLVLKYIGEKVEEPTHDEMTDAIKDINAGIDAENAAAGSNVADAAVGDAAMEAEGAAGEGGAEDEVPEVDHDAIHAAMAAAGLERRTGGGE